MAEESVVQETAPARIRVWNRYPMLREFLLLGGLYVIYSMVRNNVQGVEQIAVRNANRVIALQDTLGLNIEHVLNSRMQYGTLITIAACWFYAVFHFVVTPGVLVWLYAKHPGEYRKYRSIMIGSTLVALMIFWLYPMAPPRLTHGSGLRDIMAENAKFGWWPGTGSAPETISNQYAAMPSVHCMWAAWSGMAMFFVGRRLITKIIGILYPATTFLVVMATGHHFIMDGLVAFAILTLVTAVVKILNLGKSDVNELESTDNRQDDSYGSVTGVVNTK